MPKPVLLDALFIAFVNFLGKIMELGQSFSAPAPNPTYDVDMSESDLARWVLRLKYSIILRRRLRSSHITRRQFLLNHSGRSINCLHFKVLLGLATSAYFLAKDACPSNTVGLYCDENDLQCKLNTRDIKAILYHRGISAESFFERKDLEILSARSGSVDEFELQSALAYDDFLENFNSTCDKEATFYRSLISKLSSQHHHVLCNEDNVGLKTVVFDSPGLFIDRIEDNKESIWLLSVGFSDVDTTQAINPAIWSRLVRHFSSISIKFGILLCDKLESICSEYGFTPSILVIVLPVSYPNRKHSVEFRRLSLAHAPLCDDTTTRGRKGCILLLDHVTALLQNFLSKRVFSLQSLPQLQSPKYTRPQTLNMIWVPGERFCNKSYPLANADHHIFSRPPLAFSILSISYLGRAAFWSLDPPHPLISRPEFTQEITSFTSTINEMLQQIGCHSIEESFNGNSRYILLTSEGYCSVLSKLSFNRLDNLLRWNFPSSNDLFLFGLITVNALIIVTSLCQSLLSLKLPRFLSKCFTFLFNRTLEKSLKYDGIQSATSPLRVRTKLITNVVKATFSGWKNYTPFIAEGSKNNVSHSAGRMLRIVPVFERSLSLLFSIIFKIFLANLLFILAALPIINLVGHTVPLASILLRALRFCVYWFDLAAISPTSLTVILVLEISACAIVLTLILDSMTYWIDRKLFEKWRHFSSTSGVIPTKVDPFVAKLYKMNCAAVAFNSPALLARYLVLSDDEFPMESPRQSSSSISDSEIHPERSTETASLRACEAARLYRKAIELDKAVAMASKQSHLTWQATQNLLLHRNISSGLIFPAKLFVWKFTSTSSLSSKVSGNRPGQLKPKNASPRFAIESRGRDEDRCYEASSESDTRSHAVHPSFLGRHRRSRRLLNSNNSEPCLQWPSWVITCEECVICWREFECRTIMAALSCGHAFHAECLKSWLDVGRDVCPVCRWPAHLSHNQREKHLICQLIRALRTCLRTARNNSSNSSSTETEISAR
nr:E3 ubiquitin protein ligase RNF103 [Hymenolepis microstoma]